MISSTGLHDFDFEKITLEIDHIGKEKIEWPDFLSLVEKQLTKDDVKEHAKSIADILIGLDVLNDSILPERDVGYFYCPYVPLMVTDTVSMPDFKPSAGIVTKYAKRMISLGA